MMKQPEHREAESGFLIPNEKQFISENLNAMIGIDRPAVIDARAASEAESLGLAAKDEFHVSVIATRNGKILKKFMLDHPAQIGLEDFIKKQFEDRAWNYRLLPEYFLMEKFYTRAELEKSGYGEDVPEHHRRTLIQKIELPDLAGFYAAVNTETGLALPLPFPHVTLFSRADYAPLAQRGIGIYSEKDFRDTLKKTL